MTFSLSPLGFLDIGIRFLGHWQGPWCIWYALMWVYNGVGWYAFIAALSIYDCRHSLNAALHVLSVVPSPPFPCPLYMYLVKGTPPTILYMYSCKRVTM